MPSYLFKFICSNCKCNTGRYRYPLTVSTFYILIDFDHYYKLQSCLCFGCKSVVGSGFWREKFFFKNCCAFENFFVSARLLFLLGGGGGGFCADNFSLPFYYPASSRPEASLTRFGLQVLFVAPSYFSCCVTLSSRRST